MVMTRKTITIPEPMDAWVKAQVDGGRYGNDSEYFRDLIRRDQDRRLAEHQLRSLIDEGQESGESDDKIPEIKQRIQARLRADGRL
jgi:antitoxin ParD1/3/4